MNKVQQRVAKLVRNDIQALNAYAIPDAKNFIKLDAMENPFEWPGSLKDKWLKQLGTVRLNRYPDAAAHALRQQVLDHFDAPKDIDVLLGNGSDELISLLMQTVAGTDRAVYSFAPGFAMYKMIACYTQSEYVEIPLADDFSLEIASTLALIRAKQPELIFIARPNNPTGNSFCAQEVEQIIQAATGLVVIDEAYHAFAESSFLPLCDHYDNLLVMHTFSKVGLAGLRLGMLFGHPTWIAELNKVRLPYNIGSLTQITASFALEHSDHLRQQITYLKEQRQIVFAELRKISGLSPYPSEANFILFKTPEHQAVPFFDALKADGILIKNLNGVHPQLADCLRVTIGTAIENQKFLTSLQRAAARFPN